MDQMLRQIAAYHDGDVPDGALELYEACLKGEEPLESILPLLPHSDTFYFSEFYESTAEIGRECMRDKELLPRLGRHLRILGHIGPRVFSQTVRQLSGKLDPMDIFIESGLGPMALLAWKFDDGTPSEGTPEILEALYEMFSDELEEFSISFEGVRKIELLSFLCAKKNINPYDFVYGKEQKFLRLFSNRLAIAREFLDLSLRHLYFMLHDARISWSKLVSLVERQNAAFGKYVAQFEDSVGWTERAATDERVKTTEFMRALLLSDGKFEDFNQLASAACKLAYNFFITNFHEAMCLWRPAAPPPAHGTGGSYGDPADSSAEEQLGALEKYFETFSIPKICLCAWAARLRLGSEKSWVRAWDEMYAGDRGLLLETAKFAEAPEKIALYREIGEGAGSAGSGPMPMSECLTAVSHAFTAQFTNFMPEGAAKELHDYVMHGKEPDAGLPSIHEFVRRIHTQNFSNRPFDISCLLLTGIHPASDRYLYYLASSKYSSRTAFAAIFLRDALGMSAEEVADYMLKLSEGKDLTAFSFCLAKETTGNSMFAPRSVNMGFVKNVLDLLVAAQRNNTI